jgi:hypothetical protein
MFLANEFRRSGVMKNRIVIAFALAVAVGCGENDPISPSPSTLASLSITPATEFIKIKGTETFTVTGTYSDGSTRTEQATWGTDNPGIATIDAGGRASGVASGQASIFAETQGQRATRLLRVLPDYHGRWRGDWMVTSCGDDGDWRGACAEFPSNSLFGLSLELTQTRDTVSGTTDFGDDLPGAVTGTIRMDGPLVLGGTYTVVFEGIPVEITVGNWETVTTDNERMTGRFRLTMRTAGLQGSIGVDGEARIVAKTSAGLQFSGTNGVGSLRGAIARSLRRK